MDSECFHQIKEMYRQLNDFDMALQENFELKTQEAMVLFQLSEKDGMFSGRIATALGLSKSNCSKILVAMERKGLLRRQPCKKDTRCMRFFLDTKGKRMLKKLQNSDICVEELQPQTVEEAIEETVE